jgi:hypothetical protein
MNLIVACEKNNKSKILVLILNSFNQNNVILKCSLIGSLIFFA